MITQDEIHIVDCDSHVTEPPDLWTSRLATRWADQAPHLEWNENLQEACWRIGPSLLPGLGRFSMAGWHEYPPSHPLTIEEADPACWDSKARLERMDEYGVYAQVLYPNLIALSSQAFIHIGDPELAIACVQACNDFHVEFASIDPNRLIPIMMLPFWDIPAAMKELDRAHGMGHKGVILTAHFDRLQIGLPPLWDEHWSGLLSAIEERGLSVNFHIGFEGIYDKDWGKSQRPNFIAESSTSEKSASSGVAGHEDTDERVRRGSVFLMSNANAISDIVSKGLCHRYPCLNFVSVESGASWLPFLMESLDWHWLQFGAHRDYPERELPSFYFKRQVYGSFWFEREAVGAAVDILPDNIMFETDFPHPVSLSPGPASAAKHPRTMAFEALADVAPEAQRKVLFENAARLYNITEPVSTSRS